MLTQAERDFICPPHKRKERKKRKKKRDPYIRSGTKDSLEMQEMLLFAFGKRITSEEKIKKNLARLMLEG